MPIDAAAISKRWRNYIDGRWTESQSGDVVPVENPSTGDHVNASFVHRGPARRRQRQLRPSAARLSAGRTTHKRKRRSALRCASWCALSSLTGRLSRNFRVPSRLR